VSVFEKQPVLIVHSQAVFFAGEGWVPVTAIGGVVARDSVVNDTLHLPVVDHGAGDAPMLVCQHIEAAPNQIGTDDVGTMLNGIYSMREFSRDAEGTIRSYLPRMTDDEVKWWDEFCTAVEVGAVSGMVSGGIVGGPPGMALGLLGGTGGGGAAYVLTHPYPPPQE